MVDWCDKASASPREVNLENSQEEANIKPILHAVHASNKGAKTVRIHTDVLVLAIIRFPNLATDACIAIRTGQKRREISIRIMNDALYLFKTSAHFGCLCSYRR